VDDAAIEGDVSWIIIRGQRGLKYTGRRRSRAHRPWGLGSGFRGDCENSL